MGKHIYQAEREYLSAVLLKQNPTAASFIHILLRRNQPSKSQQLLWWKIEKGFPISAFDVLCTQNNECGRVIFFPSSVLHSLQSLPGRASRIRRQIKISAGGQRRATGLVTFPRASSHCSGFFQIEGEQHENWGTTGFVDAVGSPCSISTWLDNIEHHNSSWSCLAEGDCEF